MQDVAAQGGDLLTAQRKLGFNACSHNLFLDPFLDLGLVSIVMWDWAHCLFIGGVFDKEVDALMVLMEPYALGAGAVHVYLQSWQWPKGYAAASKICQGGKVNGTMSESLSFSLVLSKYLQDVVVPRDVPELRAAAESALHLCAVVELLMQAQTGAVCAKHLEATILEHARRQQAAYGNALWIPKSHYLLHLASARTHIRAYMYTRVRACAHFPTHAPTHVHTHIQARMRAHTHVHACTNTHT